MVLMQKTMRWYGPADPVSLAGIRQAGCSGVVTALHQVPVGDEWTAEQIKERKAVIEAAALEWNVVESLPVHDDIKRRSGNYRKWIANYGASLRNLASCGIEVVTYNFMPVLDWVRTDVKYMLPDGSEALRFDKIALAAFDIFLLERPGAEADYSAREVTAAETLIAAMTQVEKDVLFSTVMLGLPGSAEQFERTALLEAISGYEDIGGDELRSNLVDFLREVVPIAAESGIKLAIHPDDPPFPVLGLPRVVSTAKDLQIILDAVDDPANGLCFCTGSLGARADNDVSDMAETFITRTHFLHLRNTLRDSDDVFHEANHLEGDTDMFRVIGTVLAHMQRSGRSIPMRPDHGHRMLGDLERSYYPGYSEVGRLKGLAEVRGVEYAIAKQKASN